MKRLITALLFILPLSALAAPDCPSVKPGRWFKASPGFKGGWCSPDAGTKIPPGKIGEKTQVLDHTGGVRGSRTFVCQVRADGSKGWAAVAATCAQR